MLDIFKPSFWFQKRASALDDTRVRMEQMSQYNALFHLDPDKIVSAVTEYNSGNLGQLARIIRDLEQHDDKMATCSMKMKASVGRCDWSVQVKDGFEDDERAKRHVEILKRFWSTVGVTDRFKMNERGGIRLLKKQMMEAQSFGYAVHEIVWRPLANGEIAAEFVKLPLWHFENKTGALRFLPTTTAADGVPMPEGEWLVTTGDGVGIPAAICAMAKRMSFQDWLLFSERSGMPIIVGKTGAAFKSDQWNNIKAAIRSIYRDTRVLLDSASSIEAIDTGHAANIPFPPLVEWADRAIAALYRGADLSTISKGDGTGASLQGDEAGMIEQDAAENLGEVLHEQVDRFVVRYVTGDAEPLAKIVIEPVTKPDVDTDIKIDAHLVSMGCRLSKSEMMQRYGRTEATSDDDVAEQKQQQPGLPGVLGQSALPNEKDFPAPAGQFLAAGQQSQGQDADKVSRKLLESFARDTGPAADAIKELLKTIESGGDAKAEAASLVSRLPSLMPDDPAMAAVIAEEMAKEFGEVDGRAGRPLPAASHPSQEQLANEAQHCELDGGWIGDAGCTHPNHPHSALVNRIIDAAKNKKPIAISPSEAEAALKEGFYVDAGNGKRIGFGKSLLKHFNEDHDLTDEEEANDIKNRKRLLMFAVDTVMHPTKVSLNEEGYGGRKAYIKPFNTFGIKAISNEEEDKIEYVFTYRPAKSERKRK